MGTLISSSFSREFISVGEPVTWNVSFRTGNYTANYLSFDYAYKSSKYQSDGKNVYNEVKYIPGPIAANSLYTLSIDIVLTQKNVDNMVRDTSVQPTSGVIPIGVSISMGGSSQILDTISIACDTAAGYVFRVLPERIPMDFSELSYSDKSSFGGTSAESKFGNPVQRRSSITLIPTCTVDERDTSIVYRRTVTVTDPTGEVKSYDGTGIIDIDVGIVDRAGEYTAVYDIVDSIGGHVTDQVSFSVLQYEYPSIQKILTTDRDGNVVTPELLSRCKLIESTGSYDFDEIGERIWVNLQPVVTKISDVANPWKIKIDNIQKITGADGGTIPATIKDTTLVDSSLPVSTAKTYTISIGDWFSDFVSYTVDIPKAYAYLDVEPYGVAVGKMSEGTADNPLFECAYPAIFYAGIDGLNEYSYTEHEVGKWIDGRKIYRKAFRVRSITDASSMLYYLLPATNANYNLNWSGADSTTSHALPGFNANWIILEINGRNSTTDNRQFVIPTILSNAYNTLYITPNGNIALYNIGLAHYINLYIWVTYVKDN